MKQIEYSRPNANCWGSVFVEGDKDLVSYTGFSVKIPGPLPSYEFCKAHNERVGRENWEAHVSPYQDYARYMLTADGRVLFYADGINEDRHELVKDERTIELIRGLYQEDIAIEAKRREHALKIAQDKYCSSPEAVGALSCAIDYAPYWFDPMVKDGIDFYEVGHNATHSFYMGIRKDGETVSLYSASAYEGEFEYRAVETFSGGYYGHH